MVEFKKVGANIILTSLDQTPKIVAWKMNADGFGGVASPTDGDMAFQWNGCKVQITIAQGIMSKYDPSKPIVPQTTPNQGFVGVIE